MSKKEIEMKKRIINDLDHFAYSQYIKNKDVKRLLDLQKMMIEEWGNEECMLHSDLEKFNKKEPIKFPFEVLK